MEDGERVYRGELWVLVVVEFVAVTDELFDWIFINIITLIFICHFTRILEVKLPHHRVYLLRCYNILHRFPLFIFTTFLLFIYFVIFQIISAGVFLLVLGLFCI